eukprot:5303973-Heterocapsa_arctica.AAC.1
MPRRPRLPSVRACCRRPAGTSPLAHRRIPLCLAPGREVESCPIGRQRRHWMIPQVGPGSRRGR